MCCCWFFVSIREQLLSEVSAVGHCVSVLLHTLQSYQSKALRRETLSAMLAITAVDSQIPMKLLYFSQKTQNESVTSKTDADIGAKSNSPSANDRFSFTASLDPSTFLSTLIRTIGVSSCDSKISVFASFLPGMTIGLTKLVTTDSTIGSSVVILSFLTWAHYISLVLADSGAVDHTSGFTGEQEKHHELLVVRTKEWESDTDHKLSVLVQRMSVLVTSEEWRVRVVMVGWAHCLLMHCYRYVYHSLSLIPRHSLAYIFSIDNHFLFVSFIRTKHEKIVKYNKTYLIDTWDRGYYSVNL